MARDVQLDMSDVVLEKEYFCFSCKVTMERIKNNGFRCPNCGETYDETDL